MNDSTLNGRVFTTNFSENITDVTSLSIHNVGSSKMTVTVNDIPWKLNGGDKENDYAPVFVIDADGTKTKLRLKVEFEGNQGEGILMYRQFSPQNC